MCTLTTPIDTEMNDYFSTHIGGHAFSGVKNYFTLDIILAGAGKLSQ